MLFKEDIYLDNDLLMRLSKQIGIKFSEDHILTSQKQRKGGLSVSMLSIGKDSTETHTKNIKKDNYDLFIEFESEIKKYPTGVIDFDFEVAEHIFSGQLIRFRAKMLQPASKDKNFELINSIQQNPLLKGILETKLQLNNDKNGYILSSIFNNPNTKIPIYFSNDKNYLVVSAVNMNELNVNYEDFQELFDEEVNVIMLVEKKFLNNQEIVLIDMMKDLFSISRDIRRKLSIVEQEKYIIKDKGPAIQGRVLYMSR